MKFDLIIAGAGSGGLGAAITAGRLGLRVALIEAAKTLGGNAARGGVNCWEPGVGGTGLPFEIYRRLKQIPKAVGIYRHGRHLWRDPSFPGGECILDPSLRYTDSLRRFLLDGEDKLDIWHGVPFEPNDYVKVVSELLNETQNITLFSGSAVTSITQNGHRIKSVSLDDGTTLTADTFIDATASIILARLAGCRTSLGRESSQTYGESAAPKQADDSLNAVTQLYRVDPHSGQPSIEPLPEGIPSECWWAPKFPSAVFNQYPRGGWNVNMLPTMEAREFSSLRYDTAHKECARRVHAHWHHIQTVLPEMQSFRLSWLAPALGVREEQRLVGRYVLTQQDLDDTLKKQPHDNIICIADHSKDVHGEVHVHKELSFPYGVPYRCLLPREFDNLLVACRGASFSAIAASSCRLSRTMMQLGQAAGTAAALAKDQQLDVADVDTGALRTSLRKQHIQLEWPASDKLQRYLQRE
ncbi:FAD-dependent oxidoreductase [Coraliomargarita algicola]|uniref:FAD-dependent oxidoreductase n=1 Tax=Coraliomargarita algicola TaxID=3092156 RepID=A0ABZ0RP91_9BACT|nr:FAD-dependent oxidoreductase [Coraliomargarita sp. J2-16]WPJ96951.1 FAD-dependent oxidoreductase [Coraliomargarita sp. J2-16]